MPRIQIDDVEYEVAEGRTVLQAIDDLGLLMNGVDVPHYCWHPKLPIDGSCRLCQVEIEGLPKLQIACNTVVRDGMVVRTRGERVDAARRGVMELLLLNHPLDCPICDQAGECKLQDYAFDYGLKHARTEDPRRPAKKGLRLGPQIYFDQERCILCRRCVRFCREVPKTGELGVFQRGDESLLELFPGTELDNPYSMNVADICPVGALTTADFRFRIRVWFLDDVPSVCNQCSRGCNIWASRSNNRVYRYLPRRNDEVNDTWICDAGRLSYQSIAEGRLSAARVNGAEVAYAEGIQAAGARLREAHERGDGVAFAASPFMANEDLFALRELARALGSATPSFGVTRGEADAVLIREEKAPNAEGARALGFEERSAPAAAGLLIACGHALALEDLSQFGSAIVIDARDSALAERAAVALPARSFAEREGSFTNGDRRVQRFTKIVEPPFEAWSEAETLRRIAAEAGVRGFEKPRSEREWSKALCEQEPAFANAGLDALGPQGVELE